MESTNERDYNYSSQGKPQRLGMNSSIFNQKSDAPSAQGLIGQNNIAALNAMAAKRKQSPMIMPPQHYPQAQLSDEIYKTIEENINAQVKQILEKTLKGQDPYIQDHSLFAAKVQSPKDKAYTRLNSIKQGKTAKTGKHKSPKLKNSKLPSVIGSRGLPSQQRNRPSQPTYMKTQSILEEDLPYDFERSHQKPHAYKALNNVGPIRPHRIIVPDTPGAHKGDYGGPTFTPLKSRNMPHTITGTVRPKSRQPSRGRTPNRRDI